MHLWSLIENRKEFLIRDWVDALLLRMSAKRTWWVWSSKFDGGNRQEGERKQVGRETICIPMTETRRKRVRHETISNPMTERRNRRKRRPSRSIGPTPSRIRASAQGANFSILHQIRGSNSYSQSATLTRESSPAQSSCKLLQRRRNQRSKPKPHRMHARACSRRKPWRSHHRISRVQMLGNEIIWGVGNSPRASSGAAKSKLTTKPVSKTCIAPWTWPRPTSRKPCCLLPSTIAKETRGWWRLLIVTVRSVMVQL